LYLWGRLPTCGRLSIGLQPHSPKEDSLPGNHLEDDQLTRYLLGLLPAEETELLDEQSIVDDAFAARLRDAENDLIDAYAAGRLSGETLTQFQQTYLSTPERQEKVKFAQAFQTRQSSAPVIPIPNLRPRWRPNLALAAAATLILAACAYLFLQRQSLQSQLDQARADQHREIRRQERPRETQSQTAPSPAPAEPAPQTPHTLRTLAFLLLPQTRAAAQPPRVTLSPTDRPVFQLQLEFDDFPKYRATLQDPATNQTAWRSPDLTAASLGANRVITATPPASLLKPQNYVLVLTGLPTTGPTELIGSYAFSVVIK
jgi:hypothetical protein